MTALDLPTLARESWQPRQRGLLQVVALVARAPLWLNPVGTLPACNDGPEVGLRAASTPDDAAIDRMPTCGRAYASACISVDATTRPPDCSNTCPHVGMRACRQTLTAGGKDIPALRHCPPERGAAPWRARTHNGARDTLVPRSPLASQPDRIRPMPNGDLEVLVRITLKRLWA